MATLFKTLGAKFIIGFICSIENKAYKSRLVGIPINRKAAMQLKLYLCCRSLAQNKFLKHLKYYAVIFCACLANYCMAQTTFEGVVTDNRKHPVIDASVYIKGKMNAATTDSSGHFLFTAELKGKQTIVASSVGFKETEKNRQAGCA
jgi:hypothetical protein